MTTVYQSWTDRTPREWRAVRLKDVVELDNGFPLPAEGFNHESGVPVIRIRDLVRGVSETFYDGPVTAAPVLADGDLLVGMDGDFNLVRWFGGEGLLNQRVCRVRPRSAITAGFVYYSLPLTLREVNDLTFFTTVKHLSSRDLLGRRFSLPPLAVQNQVVDFLDRETARIDALVEKKRRLIDLLAEKRTALITEAVTKGLDPSVPMKGSGVEWIGEIPETWEVVRLRFLAAVQTGITLGRKYEPTERLVSRPYLRVANVQSGYLDLAEITMIDLPPSEAHRYRLQRGDVLMTEGGDIDKLGRGVVWEGEIGDCLHQNHIFAVRPGPQLRPEFLEYLLGIGHGRTYFELTAKRTTNLASTNTAQLKGFPVLLPRVHEQKALINEIEARTSTIARATENLAHQLDLLAEYREALITAAVTGALDVDEFDGDRAVDEAVVG